MRLRTLLLATVAAVVMTACSDPFGLPTATEENNLDTVTLGALHFTPVSLPSAYSVTAGRIRTEVSTNYDMVYDIDSVLGPVLLPAQLTGVYFPSATNPGLQRTTTPFDSIKIAPSNGYKVDQPFAVDTGDLFLLRSAIRCGNGVPNYAKLQILSIDSVAFTVTFLVRRDTNCGYRGLESGVPGH
ncbi:MAG: hypothetical protein JF590_03040 [Gemmatimonadetes bacterium]|nr:hypothetical protein [Gemmatimonadota bacterium]